MLHLLLLIVYKFDFLLSGFLLTDLAIKHSHQMINFVYLTAELVSVIIALCIRLIEFIVCFLNFCNSQSRLNQVFCQLFLDFSSSLVNKGNIFQLLSVVCAAFLLFRINLHYYSVDLL